MTSQKITMVADLNDACGEGPLWEPRSQTLHWVDITGERLHTLAWPDGTVRTVQPGVPLSALALTDTAPLVLAGGNGVWLWSEDSTLTAIAREHEGKPLGVNDCIADSRGRLLIGTTFFDGSDNYAPGSLYSIEANGAMRTLDTGFGLANGMGFSVDGETLYATDSVARSIYAYDYDNAAGSVSHRRLFVQVPRHEGMPDGLTVDAEDHVWSAQWFGGCVCRYSPDGRLERRIIISASQTSSLTFGGPNLTDIFVTSAAVPDALSFAPPGYAPTSTVGGQLFHFNIGVAGKLEHRCQLQHIPRPKEDTLTHAPA